MADNTVRYGNTPNILRAKAIVIKTAQPLMVTQRVGIDAVMPRGQGKIATIRRYDDLPLVEGVTPEDGQPETYQPTARDITAPVVELSAKVLLDRSAVDFSDDNIPDQVAELLGQQQAKSNELYSLNMLKGGTNVYRAGAVSSRSAIATGISPTDLKMILRQLRGYNVPKITRTIKATDGVSTTPIPHCYLAFVPEIARDNLVANLPGFIEYQYYADSDKAFPEEIGSWEGIRFLPTTLLTPWLAAGANASGYLSNGVAQTGRVDVYPMFIMGDQAYARIRIAGRNGTNLMVVLPGSRESFTHDNPTGKKGFISWWNYQCVRIANERHFWRYEFAVTGTAA